MELTPPALCCALLSWKMGEPSLQTWILVKIMNLNVENYERNDRRDRLKVSKALLDIGLGPSYWADIRGEGHGRNGYNGLSPISFTNGLIF